MKNIKLVICDKNLSYLNHFLKYFREEKLLLYEVIGFSEENGLKDYIHNNKVDILLCSLDFNIQFVLENCIEDVHKKDRSSKPLIINISEDADSEDNEPVQSIFKYQSVQEILNKAVNAFLKSNPTTITKTFNKISTCELISVYSPYRNIETEYISFALALAAFKDKKVLYISFKQYQTISILTDTVNTGTLSDLIYYLKQDNSNLSMKLTTIPTLVGGVHCIFGLEHELDLYQITVKDIKKMLDELKEMNIYDIVVCNIGFLNDAMMDLMIESNVVHTLASRSTVEEYQMNCFYQLLEQEDRYDLKDLIIPINMPLEFNIVEHFHVQHMTNYGIIEYMGQLMNTDRKMSGYSNEGV